MQSSTPLSIAYQIDVLIDFNVCDSWSLLLLCFILHWQAIMRVLSPTDFKNWALRNGPCSFIIQFERKSTSIERRISILSCAMLIQPVWIRFLFLQLCSFSTGTFLFFSNSQDRKYGWGNLWGCCVIALWSPDPCFLKNRSFCRAWYRKKACGAIKSRKALVGILIKATFFKACGFHKHKSYVFTWLPLTKIAIMASAHIASFIR